MYLAGKHSVYEGDCYYFMLASVVPTEAERSLYPGPGEEKMGKGWCGIYGQRLGGRKERCFYRYHLTVKASKIYSNNKRKAHGQ